MILTDTDIETWIDYSRIRPGSLERGYRAMVSQLRCGYCWALASEAAAISERLNQDERRALGGLRDAATKEEWQAVLLLRLEPVKRGRKWKRKPANDVKAEVDVRKWPHVAELLYYISKAETEKGTQWPSGRMTPKRCCRN